MSLQAVDPQRTLESTGRSRIETLFPRSLREKILRNGLWSTAGKFFCIPLNLLLVPFIVSSLGPERYGLWVALFALVDYFILFDLGVGAATIKLAAEFEAEDDTGRLARLAATALLLGLVFVPPLAVAYGFAAELLELLRLAPSDPAEAVRVFRWVLALFALTLVQGVFRNLLFGLQRIHLLNLCEMVYFLLYALATVAILRCGGGLEALALAILILRGALGIAEALIFLRSAPQLRRHAWRPDRRIAGRLFRYGGRLQLTSVAGLLNFQYDKLLIGYFLRVEFVAFYELGSKLAGLVRLVPSALLGPVIPAAAELAAGEKIGALRELYRTGTRYLVLLAAPAAAILFFHAEAVHALWLGGQADPRAALALRWLAVAYFFNVSTGVANSIGRGAGWLRPEMEASAAVSLINIVSSGGLVLLWGYPGVLAGTALAMVAGNLIYLQRFGRSIGEPWGRLLRETMVRPLACAVGAGFASRLFFLLLKPEESFPGRLDVLAPLAAALLFFSLLFLGGIGIAKSVSLQDVLRVREALGLIRPR